MKQKKKIAFLTLVIILINLFSPYSILLHKVNAASGTLPDPVVVFNKIQNITEKNGNKFFKVQVAVVGDINVKGLDLKLTYDNTKIQPAVKTTGASNTNIALTSETYPDMADGMYTIKTYDKTSEEYRVQYAKSGGHDLPDLCYSAGMGWDALYEDYDTWASGFDYYLPIITYTFRLVDTTLTDDDITTELFDLVPVTGSLPSGAQIVYENASGIDVAYDIPEIKGVGFATPTKTVSMIAIKNNPTNTTYDHGETIDLTGGMITVTYSDGSTEDISMEDSKIAIKSGSPADVNNPSVTIDYGGKQTSFNITVNDPVKSLTVATPMSDVEYNQNESFDFSSLVLTATKKSGATQSLTTSSSGVQVSENTADVNSPNFTQASASGVVPISGTQKIVFTYEGKTATQTVLVNDTIASVDVISQPTKTVYKRGESLELAGAVVKLTLGSGATANINLPDGSVSVSSYSNTTTGRKQNLTVSVAGINATQTIDVEAYNYITGSTLTAPTKSSYQYKEELNLAGGQLKFNWHDGNITTISLTDDMVSGYNKTTLGTQTINVNYTATYTLSDSSIITDAITDTFDVFVIDTVTGITVTAPTKDTYYHGDSLNLAGGTITVNYASGASTNVTMTESMIKESDGSAVNMSPASSEYAANHTLAKTLKIEYTEGGETGSTNYPITIIDKVVSVAIHTTPKTNYNVNETLDLTNGEIAVTRASSTIPEIISMSNANVTVEGFASNVEASNLPLTVKYTENGITESTSYNVNVTDTVTSVSVSNAPTTVKVGEELDLSGMTITVTKGSGTTTVPVSSATITGYDKNTLGPQTVTVSYGGQSDTFNVTVQDYVTGITVNPSSVTGNYNDELSSIINNNNITYTVTYASAGAKSPVALAESMVTGYSKTTISAQTLTVTYTDNDTNSYTNGTGFTANLTVTLQDPVTGITVTAPTKSTYYHGDSLALAGGTITVNYASGASTNVTMTESMIKESDGSTVNMSPAASNYGANHTLAKTLKIEYTEGGKTGSINYPITIIDKVVNVAMHTTPKTNYNVNEALDLTNGEIAVTRASSTTQEIISMSNANVTVEGFASNVEASNLPLTVKYTENGITESTTYNINVTDTVTSVSVTNAPTTVKVGEELDLSGMTITVTKGSGTTTVPVSSASITGYDKNTLGPQTVTVSYGGQSDTFSVTVKDYVTGITVNPSSVTGNYNDELSSIINNNNITYTVTYASAGAKSPVALAESMVTGYSKTTTSAQNLTVTYTDNDTNSYTNGTGFTASLTVTLQDTVTGITVTAPTKDTYYHGDSLDLAGGTITVNYASGASTNVTMTESMIKESDGSAVNMSPASSEYAADHTLSKTLKIEYTEGGETGSTNYPITIIDKVVSVAMHTTPKTNYNVNETLDLTNGEIAVTRASTTTQEIISMSNANVTVEGFASNVEASNLPLTVKYTENGITESTSYNVNVTDTVTSVSVSNAPTTVKVGEELDLSGMTITVTKGSGTTTVPVSSATITGYDKNTLGPQTVTVSYGGQSDTFNVTVQDYVTGITVNPSSVTGNYNDELSSIINNNNITYTVTYASAGAKSPVALAESMVTGYSKTTTSAQNLTVTYTDNDTNSYTNGTDFTASLTVTLQDTVTSVNVSNAPTTAKVGEELDLSGMIITVTKGSGTTTIPVSSATITGYDKNTLGPQTITVSYGGQSDTFSVTVKDYVTGITVNPSSVTGNYNDELSSIINDNNITYTVTYASAGAKSPVALAESMVTGYSKTTTSAQNLTVTYTDNDTDSYTNGTDFTANLTVTLQDTVTSVSVSNAPTTAKVGEELDLSGMTITVTKGSGTTTVPVSSATITGYDKNILGPQTVTVSYGGQSDTFSVTVKDYVTGITVNPSSVTGNYNDELSSIINNNNITYTVTYASAGAKSPVALAESMVTGYSKTTTSAQNLTVTYTDNDTNSYTNGTGFTANLTVTLQDTVTSVSVSNAPTTAKVGEELDLSGMTITVTKGSGTTTVPVSSATITGYDKNTLGPQTVTVSYGGQSDTFSVTVKDYVTGITVNPSSVTGNYNDELSSIINNNNITYTVTYASAGAKSPVALAESMVTGYSKTTTSAQNLTVTYADNDTNSYTNGTDFTASLTVTLQDNVSSISIATMPKQNYKYGETLDVSSGTLDIVRNSGPATIPMTSDMITELDGSAFNSTRLGTRDLKISYGGKTVTYEVTVSDYVKGIILTPPTKVKYEYGEALKLDGGSIQKIMASGQPTTPVALTDSSVTLSTFNPNQVGAQTIDVTFEGHTEHFGVIVEDNIQSITMKKNPDNTTFKFGEALDVTGGKIEATRTSGNKSEITITSSMVTNYDPNTLGEQELTVTYQGKTTTYKVNVVDYIIGIEIEKPEKLIYKIGEPIDLSSGKVKVIMASGTALSPIAFSDADVTITGFDTTTEGAKTIKVTYKGFSKTFGITVVDPLSEVTIETLPNKLDYRYGESLDVTGATLKVSKESGATDIVKVTKDMVTGYNPKKLGNQTLTITYEGKQLEFIVNVKDYISKLKVEVPEKTEYEYGEELDLSKGKVSVIMASGTIEETVPMTASMVSGYDKTKEGKQTIQVEYKGLQGKFQVNVVDKVKGISMNTEPNKVEYKYGESLDVTGATITVIKSSGIKTIKVTKDMVSGYDASTPGTQVITVTYGGFTTKFIVIVDKKEEPEEPVTPEEPQKPEEKPQTPEEEKPNTSKPSTSKPSTQKPNSTKPNTTEPSTQIPEEITEPEEPVTPEEPQKPEEKPQTPEEEKPTATLGVKDEKEDETIRNRKVLAGIFGGIGLLILFILIFFKRNVKIYVEEDGEFVLGGVDKIKKKHPKLDIDQYLDGNTYPNRVKVHLSDSISEKLDGKEIEIKHRGKVVTHKVEYKDEPYEFILE